MSSSQFGYATQMLNNYQSPEARAEVSIRCTKIGGPRSIQLALKLQF
jgi:hypothetical protein